MPRRVRNFWVEVDIDGRKHKLTGGPRGRSGGFNLTIMQREDGVVTVPVEINGYTIDDEIVLLVELPRRPCGAARPSVRHSTRR